MPLYYLNDNLNVAGTRLEMFSVHGLYQLSQKSRDELVELSLVREIKTVSVDSYDEFSECATIVKDAGFETLGDFAGANPDDLSEDLIPIQEQAIAFLHPARPAGIPLEDCCG